MAGVQCRIGCRALVATNHEPNSHCKKPSGASEPSIYLHALSRTGSLDAPAWRLLVSNGTMAMSIDQVKPVPQFIRVDILKGGILMQWFAQSRIIDREGFAEVPSPRKSINREKGLVAELIRR